MKVFRIAAALLGGVLLLVSTACNTQPADPADLILHNGFVWTVNENQPQAQAVAVRGNRIVAVGTDSEILALAGPETRQIDLEGKFLQPGFNDNHVHFASAARFLEFNIMAAGTQEEFVNRVREVQAKLPEGDWILGGFWGAYDQWASGSAGGESREPFAPDVRLVEDLTRNNPLLIQKFDRSAFAANRAALEAANLDPEKPSAKNVEFLKDAQGYTGVFRGKGARELFSELIPRTFSHQRRLQQTRDALAEIRKYGVVSVSDMSDAEQLEIYRELRSASELTVRVHYRPHLETWADLEQSGIRIGSGDEWIQLGSVKGHIDGIMGTSGARFFEPYAHDPDNRGYWRRLMVDDKGDFVEGKFLGYMLNADKANIQLTVHAIGDEANNLLLNYLEELNRVNGAKDRRFRLVHAQVVQESDFARLGQLGVVAEVQPFHLSDDMRWMEERIGHERCKGAYAFKNIQNSGAIMTFGTDWPGTSAAEYPINPMLGLYAAVTRQTVSGEPPEGWFPDERITMEEAIKAYTYNTAYGNFEEKERGSIEPGKLADLTVLSRNLLEATPAQVLDTRVLYTIVDGKVVYDAAAQKD